MGSYINIQKSVQLHVHSSKHQQYILPQAYYKSSYRLLTNFVVGVMYFFHRTDFICYWKVIYCPPNSLGTLSPVGKYLLEGRDQSIQFSQMENSLMIFLSYKHAQHLLAYKPWADREKNPSSALASLFCDLYLKYMVSSAIQSQHQVR